MNISNPKEKKKGGPTLRSSSLRLKHMSRIIIIIYYYFITDIFECVWPPLTHVQKPLFMKRVWEAKVRYLWFGHMFNRVELGLKVSRFSYSL